MRTQWNLQSVFLALKAQFMDNVVIAAFATSPIPPSDVLNMLIAIILAMSVFQLEYTDWHALPVGQRTILNAWD